MNWKKDILRILRFLFFPLSLAYLFLFYFRRALVCPVSLPSLCTISVGNLTVGGTGKTPQIFRLIEDLSFASHPFVVLTRGYRSKGSRSGGLVSLDSSACLVGDEPLLIKRRFPEVTVVIGRNRIQSFCTYYRSIGELPPIILLDDGFQHFAIQRDLDIVLIDSLRGLGSGFTIPLDILREPLSALKRATIVIFTRYNREVLSPEQIQTVASLEKKIQTLFPHLIVFHSYEKITGIFEYKNRTWQLSSKIKSVDAEEIFAFCGIGNPDSFYKILESFLGKSFSKKKYSDHYRYTERDIQYLLDRKEKYLICTEKDIVKFTDLDLQKLEGRLCFLRIDTEIIETGWKDFLKVWLEKFLSERK